MSMILSKLICKRLFSSLPPSGRRNANEMLPAILDQLAKTKSSVYTEKEVTEKELPARSINDSHAEFCIPLSTDSEKQAEYLSASGNVRLGKLLEDLDQLAVWVSLSHNREGSHDGIGECGSLPRTIVTASVQSIDMHRKQLHPSRDIVIDGRVTWTGRSSMETSLRVFQNDHNNHLQQMMRARFIMVSRHPATGGSVRVHPLCASTVDESAIINAGEEAAAERKRQKSTSLLNSHPSLDEFRTLHDNFLQAMRRRTDSLYDVKLSEHQAWLHDTRAEVKLICFPEHQNMYGKIFGGFLMRQALELAYLNAKIFCKGRMHIISVDDISFARPVEIGDVLELNCVLTYSSGKYLQARVTAEVIADKSFEKHTSNVFHFTLEARDSTNIREIVPKYYEHAIMWLNGKRHCETALMKLPADCEEVSSMEEMRRSI